MTTLMYFQTMVLRPLREERDQAMLDSYKREAEIKAAYRNELDQIAIDQKEFAKKQAQELKMFNLKLNERRAKAHSSILMEMAR